MSAEIDGNDVATEDKRICADCIREGYLAAEVGRNGDDGSCAYCKQYGKTISIGALAEHVDGAFKRHYHRTAIEASSLEYMMMKESDYIWERTGEPAVYAIANAAGIDEGPAEDVRQILEERNAGYDELGFGEESEFESDAHYEEGDADASELHYEWLRFQKSLKTETRLFNTSAQAVLDSIFDGLDGHATRHGKKAIINVGPHRRLSSVYRARVFQSDEKIEEALRRPDRELGPPPLAAASAGRMNSRGIAVFYGATHPDVALSETRPPVGSRVLLGRFSIIRSLRLLDVEALRSIFVDGSIFDAGYIERLKKAKFLASLSEQITKPVMPDDEPFEYLVTQGIADYLATKREPQLDGIIYRSVQHGKSRKNIVLFHKAARVESLDIPEGSEVSAHLYDHSDEGTTPDYLVFERVPVLKKKKQKESGVDWFGLAEYSHHASRQTGDDERISALRVDLESLKVHHVERATFKTVDFPVRRHRVEKGETEDF